MVYRNRDEGYVMREQNQMYLLNYLSSKRHGVTTGEALRQLYIADKKSGLIFDVIG